jgi:hypothetical protein
MSDALYVPTDANGVEHAATGPIKWTLPSEHGATDITPGRTLILRRAPSLLDVLDERVFVAATNEAARITGKGTLEVATARLTEETSWNTESATSFAMSCAQHLLSEVGDVALPDGTSLVGILADARKVLEGISSDAADRLDYLARVRALRRLKHARREIAGESLSTLVDDEVKDVDALDDPAYETLAPITDAVLAAIEALRHHVYPHLYMRAEDANDERLEHGVEDRQTVLRQPTEVVTPFGAASFGGGMPNIDYDPAWTSAREAARHARQAIKDRQGSKAELDELQWQADALEKELNA